MRLRVITGALKLSKSAGLSARSATRRTVVLAPTDIRSANKMSDADTFHEQVPDDAEGSDDAKEPADDAEPMDDDAVVDEKGKAEGSPRVRRKVPAHCGFPAWCRWR
jgi:hypothetical protein